MARNVTVDDEQLVFTPFWKPSSECDGCSAAPTAAQMAFVHDGTWHDGARQADGSPGVMTMSYTFTGTAVYVYGITINGTSARPAIKNVDLTFTLNNAHAGDFTYAPDATVTDYHFNVLFFSKTGLPNAQYTLQMSLNPHSFALLDYVQYT
ncbi:hypothetical protein EXIGLDRAFT_65199 [Exidia glandulosa HHB12029]|uniref:Uncharacterized protein n=1 Tax=Exidia glandulosa HHB12029 TaxID=1314781 RepID=A0A165P274_EXIGL|nr:hypothetical protein EXIGLDRAFT_65199 [Exidia glandulosa HHB12029]